VQTQQPTFQTSEGSYPFLEGKDSQNGVVVPNSVGLHELTVNLGSTGSSTGNNFADLWPASLHGNVYYDANDNGVFDTGEAPLPGTVITLTGTDDTGASVTRTTSTAADGSYNFWDLRPGTYSLTEAQPAGYLQGKNSAGAAGGTDDNNVASPTHDVISNIALNSGVNAYNYNFGEVKPASLSGYVYLDPDNNGIKEAGEPGIPGVTVTLTGTDDNGTAVTATTTTASDGSYSFTTLRPGTYAVTETHPAGYTDGKDTAGSAGGTARTLAPSITTSPSCRMRTWPSSRRPTQPP
jgi:hypothetical protein